MADKPRYAESRWSKGPIYIGPLGDPNNRSLRLNEIGLDPGDGATSDQEMFPEAVNKLKGQFPERSQERRFLETGIPQDRGSMYVNPKFEAGDPRNSHLFRHEAVHNLLDNALNKTDENQGLRTLRQWHKKPRIKPYADEVKRALKSGGWAGEPEKEIPAFMGAEDPEMQVETDVRQGYMRELMRLMQRTNPREAAILRRMSESVVGETPRK